MHACFIPFFPKQSKDLWPILLNGSFYAYGIYDKSTEKTM